MEFNKIDKISDFLGGIWKYNIASKFISLKPRSLIINITYMCNSRCIMCNIWKMKPKDELTFIDWKKVMEDNIFSNIKTLTISGGEAFLYNNYFKTVKLYIDSMPKLNRLVLNTNGFLVDKIIDNVVKVNEYCKLKKVKLSVSISIDGIGETHDEIRNTPGGFNKAQETLNKLIIINKKNKFNLGVASLLMDKNIEKYKELKQWFKKRKIDHSFQLIGFHESYVNNLDEENSLGFVGSKKNKIFEVLKDLKRGTKIFDFNTYYWNDMYEMYKKHTRRTTPCPFLKDGFVIDSLGDVYYCLSVKPIGNFIKEKKSVSEIYFSPKNIKFRNNLWNNDCKYCNSGCEINKTIAYDFKKYFWFKITGKTLNI